MKPLRILSFVLMGLGMLLVITGSLFRIQHWPYAFYGLISGPLIELIGIVIFVFTVIKNKKQNAL